MSKWQIDPANPPGKIQVNRFNDAVGKLSMEDHTFRELGGVKGADEHEHCYTQLFGGGDREDVKADRARIGEWFKWTLTRTNIGEATEAILNALTVLAKNRPVVDNRKDPETAAKEQTERKEAEAKHEADEKARNAAFVRLYGKGEGEMVTVKPGGMAVTIRLCYDNSDSMTDYFDRHASLSPRFCLMVCAKQAETQSLARSALALVTELRDIGFEWKTEKYSMGHGNYLESKGHELPEELKGAAKLYRGGEVTHAHWEVEFEHPYNSTKQILAHKDYTDHATPSHTIGGAKGMVTENGPLNGIEIRFAEKPDPTVIANLKANGWRWTFKSKCWYKRASDEARAFAHNLAGTKCVETAAVGN